VCELNATEQGYAETMLGTSGATGGRAQALTMEMGTDSGFHPFGPQESATGVFTVSVSGNHTGKLPAPFNQYKTALTIVKTSAAFPAYTYGASNDDGDALTIGTVTGLRWPVNWANAMNSWGFTNTIKQNGAAGYIDRGTSADKYSTSLVLIQEENKMAEVADYLIGTARGGSFTITTSGMTPFGKQKSDGVYTVRLAQGDLEFTHMANNMWQTTLDLSYISGPAA
jgi:hypothetical protein